MECDPRTLIFTSGTLSPLDTWEKELNIKATVRLSNQHVIRPSQVGVNVVSRNMEGALMNFTYQNIRLTDPGELYSGLLETMFEISRRVPHGIVVICPNFRMLRDIKFYATSYPFRKFQKLKKMIFEERGSERYIEDFKNCSGRGAILFCVCRGRASEGIDFPNHHCRAVIFVGVPFPNIKDPILIEKKGHFDRLKKAQEKDPRVSVVGWEEWYFNNTMRAVSQGIGRVIRHSQDYGLVFLFDERYGDRRFVKALPQWTSPSTNHWNSFGER